MSYNNTEGFSNNTSSAGGEGFRDSSGGVESYGQGTGSGAYDPANTGLGGYGSSDRQRGSNDQTSGTTGFGDSTSGGQDQTQSSGQRAFGGDREREKVGFGGSDSSYNDTTTGGTFNDSGLNQGSGTGQSDAFGGDNNSSSIPGSRSTGGASGGQYDNNSNSDSFGDNNDSNRDEFSTGQQSGNRNRDDFSTNQNSGQSDDQFGGESETGRQGGKPSMGDKMKGTFEKVAGTVTGKPEVKERGQERKTGGF